MRRRQKNSNSHGILRIAILLPVTSFLIYDLIVDAFFEGEYATTHFIVETVVFLSVLVVLVIGLRDLADLRTRLQREKTRNKVLAGELADGIDAQMDEWKLTPSEREIAWMIIKGYRFAEIAKLRQVKEGTTRLQATTLYAKAGIRGRGEFVAEIIHQLLAPILEDSSSDKAPPPSKTNIELADMA